MSSSIQVILKVEQSNANLCACPGAHTLGKARCSTFNSRLSGNSNADEAPNVNLDFIQSLQQLCTQSNTTLADLDLNTPMTFDNQYYINLLSGEGLLASDQVLVAGDERTKELVESYVDSPIAFIEEFKKSMIRMGGLLPVPGENGEIRRDCRFTNEINS